MHDIYFIKERMFCKTVADWFSRLFLTTVGTLGCIATNEKFLL